MDHGDTLRPLFTQHSPNVFESTILQLLATTYTRTKKKRRVTSTVVYNLGLFARGLRIKTELTFK